MKLLVADPHEEFRRSLVEYVKTHRDLQVVGEARDGVEAVRMTRWLRPDVVLLNVRMRRLDWWTAAKAIKLLFPSTRVVVISLEETREQGVRGGELMIDAMLERDRITSDLPKVIARIRSEMAESEKERDFRRNLSKKTE